MAPPQKKLGDLRKPRTPAGVPPAGGVPPQLRGLVGGMPLMPGHVVMTDFEKAELKKHGWKEGDPIPQDLPALYAAVAAAKAAAAAPPEIDPAARDFVPPPEQDIRTLPQARRDELAEALKAAAAQGRAYQKQQAAQVPGAGPGVNEAITAGLIEDDLGPPKVAAPPPAAPPPPTDADLDARPGAGAAEAPKTCSHCGWEVGRDEAVEATPEDKLRWLVAQEGAQRFGKDYQLLGGRMTVTFRSLTAKESDTAWRQVAVDGHRDIKAQLVETEDNYWRNLMTYRMVMSIERLWSAAQGPQDNPVLDDWQVDRADYPAPHTKLYAVLPAVTEALFPTETLRRQLGNAFHRFQLLVEHLEARADDDVFWHGIGQPS